MTISYSYKLDHSPTLQGERFCSNQWYIREHSTIVTLDKNILRHYCRTKREKEQENTSSNTKQIVDLISHNTKVVLHSDAIIIS